MKTTVAAIDFGTSKIVTLVAENSGSQRCDIVGAGVTGYDGFLREGWNNPAEIDERIHQSISDAEKQCRRTLHEINVGVPGAFTTVFATEVSVPLTGPDPKVTVNDVKKAFRQARDSMGEVTGRIIIHSSPAWFMVDGSKKTLEPVGMKGSELTAYISFVLADQFFVDDVNNRLAAMNITAAGFYSAIAGEAMLYLDEEERDRTAVLVDIGYLTTDVMVVEGDAITSHKSVDIGGGNIAADLAIGLDLPLKQAEEKIKRPYIYSLGSDEETFDIPAVDGQKAVSFTRAQVSEMILPRVDEIAEEIQKALEESGVRLGNWSNIYLTGGGLAINRGGRDYLSGKLGRPVRDIPKRTTKLNSHTYSSTLGLMDLIIDTMEQQRQPASGFGGKVQGFFRSLLGNG